MATKNTKKYLVRVPSGKGTNDFQFDELSPAFIKYCSKLTQNQATRIAYYYTNLDVPKDMSWAELLSDVTDRYHESLSLIERLNKLPQNEAGQFIITAKVRDDFKEIDRLMSHVGPAVWNLWDELSKIYWKSSIPRIRMLLEEAVVEG